MAKIIKGGICISIIYLLAIGCTLLVSSRIQEIDANNQFRNSNSSLSIKLKG